MEKATKELSGLETLLAETFDRAEELIEDGGSAAEFLVALAKFMGHFYNRHFPANLHGYLTTNFGNQVNVFSRELRKVYPYSNELHLVLIHSNEK